jgi:copper chaperone CopZ
MKTLNLIVEGMKCGGCASKIKDHFSAQDLVQKVEVDLENRLVTILGEDSLSNMGTKSEVEELGFSVISIKKA